MNSLENWQYIVKLLKALTITTYVEREMKICEYTRLKT